MGDDEVVGEAAGLLDALRKLREKVGRPNDRQMQARAKELGLSLSRSTANSLQHGKGKPLWDTVVTFVRVCEEYNKRLPSSRRLPDAEFDLTVWHKRWEKASVTPTDPPSVEERYDHKLTVAPEFLSYPSGFPRPPPIPLVVPRRRVATDRLRGRDKLVAVLTEAVKGRAAGSEQDIPGVWALCGLGGCGKTTVAIEVAHRVSLRRRWWVSASDKTGLDAALHAVALDAGASLAEFNNAHPADVLWWHLNSLPDPWLLVLDNADDIDVLSADERRAAEGVGWLRQPENSRGTVIVTSRDTRSERWGSWVKTLPVDSLGMEDGGRILLDLAPEAGSAAEAQELAKYLGGLPLALDLAGSYLAAAARAIWPDPDTPDTFIDYRAAFADRLPDVAVDHDATLSKPEKDRRDITTTWELSLDLLTRQGHDPARPLLRLLSCFGDAPLPHRAVLDLNLLANSPLFIKPTSRRLNGALQGLAGLGLISVVDRGSRTPEFRRALGLHPVVRASNREHPDVKDRAADYLSLLSALLERATASWDPSDPACWAGWDALAPHCTAALRLLVYDGMSTEHAIAATVPALRSARYYLAGGLYKNVEAEIRNIVRIREKWLGETHPETLISRRHLAHALLEGGQLHEAEEEYRSVFDSSLQVFEVEDPHMLSTRRGLGRALRDCGRLNDAEDEFRNLLEVQLKNASKKSDPEVLLTRQELATVFSRLGRYRSAEEEFRTLLAMRNKRLGEAHLATLINRLGLIQALRGEGRLEEAEIECRSVLKISERVFNAEHQILLAARHELARIVRDRGHPEEAEADFRTIWEVCSRRLGDDHPATIATLHEIATTLHIRGLLNEAKTEFETVWMINRRKLGDDHPNTLTSYHNLSLVLFECGQVEEALTGLRTVAATRENVLGDRHPETLASRYCIEEIENCRANIASGFRLKNNADSKSGSEADRPISGEYNESKTEGAGMKKGLTDPLGVIESDLPDLGGLSLKEITSLDRVTLKSSMDRLLRRSAHPEIYIGGGSGGEGGDFRYSTALPWHSSKRETQSSSSRSSKVTYSNKAARENLGSVTEKTLALELEKKHGLSPDVFRDLARGQGDSQVIETLWAGQWSSRRLLIREVVEMAQANTEAQGPLLAIEEAWKLLSKAENSSPRLVKEVLLYPQVGRWVGHALRRLRGIISTTFPLWTDVGHLHAIAASAGISAGLEFSCRIPLRSGIAVIPRLGLAEFPSTAPSFAELHVDSGGARIEAAGLTIYVPRERDIESEGWHELRELGAYAEGKRFRLWIDDIDPYRGISSYSPASRLPTQQVDHWKNLLAEAWNMLVDADADEAAALAAAVTTIAPLPELSEPDSISASSAEAFGGIILASPIDSTKFAEVLIREFQHTKLNGLLNLVDLYNENDELFYAPWRNDPRPLSGLFQGIYAFLGVTNFWRQRKIFTTGASARCAQFEFAYCRLQTWDTLAILKSRSELTSLGKIFVEEMAERMRPWLEESVPEAIESLARDAAIDHRAS